TIAMSCPIRSTLASILIGTALLAAAAASSSPARAQAPAIDHVEPPFWWAGMHDKKLQLMVHGPAIADLEPALDYPGVRIAQVTRVANRNYLFLDLVIEDGVAPGSMRIDFRGKGDAAGRSASHVYRLLAREAGSNQRKGFDT